MLGRRITLVGAALMTVLLLGIACGGEDEEAAAPAAAAPAAEATAAPAAAAEAAPAAEAEAAAPAAEAEAAAPVAAVVEETAGVSEALVLGALTTNDVKGANYGGVARAMQYSSAPNLDRVDITGQWGDALLGGLYNKLFEWDPFNPVVQKPALATCWTVADDNKTYTISLRKDVTWHDGVPFTADDVVGTWDWYLFTYNNFGRGRRVGGFLKKFVNPADGWGSYKAVDAHTVEVELGAPASGFMPLITSAQHWMMPAHEVTKDLGAETYVPAHSGDAAPPLGTGPFKYKKWVQDVSIEWERNENYWKKDPFGNQLPYLDGFLGMVLTDKALQFASFKTSRIYWWPTFPIMNPAQQKDVKEGLGAEGKVVIREGSSHLLEGNVINLDWSYGREDDFRWAVALIMDQEEYLERVFGGAAIVGAVLDPRIFPTFALPQEEIDTSPWMKQPKTEAYAEAKTLLAGLGITEAAPLELRIVCRNSSFYCAEAEVLASQLNKFGTFKPKVEAYTPSVGSSRVREGLFEMNTQASGITVADPLNPLQQRFQADAPPREWILPNGDPDPDRIRINELTQKAANELDPEAQKQMIWELQRILYFEDLNLIPLGYPSTVIPVWNFVKGLCNFGGLYECQNREYVWLDQ